MTNIKSPARANVRGSVTEAQPTKLASDIEIDNLRAVTSKRGTTMTLFNVAIAGLGLVRDCSIRWSERAQCFQVFGPGMRSTFAAGGWCEHVSFDLDVKAAILEIVLPRLEADRAGYAS